MSDKQPKPNHKAFDRIEIGNGSPLNIGGILLNTEYARFKQLIKSFFDYVLPYNHPMIPLIQMRTTAIQALNDTTCHSIYEHAKEIGPANVTLLIDECIESFHRMQRQLEEESGIDGKNQTPTQKGE